MQHSSRRFGRLGLLILAGSSTLAQLPQHQPGWIYVLDVGGVTGSVIVVDPASGSIKATLPTGYHPDIGVCGSKLYVVSGSQASSTLSVYSTQSGDLLNTLTLAHRAVYTVWPSNAGLVCSGDGRWMFLQQMTSVGVGRDQHALWAIDTQSDRLAPSLVPLPSGCGIAQLFPWPFGKWTISAQCSVTNTLRLIGIDDYGNADNITDVALNLAPAPAVRAPGQADPQRKTVEALADRTAGVIDIFRPVGGVDQLNPATLSLIPKAADSWQTWTPGGAIAVSPSGIVFLGSTPYEQRTAGDDFLTAISAVRTTDWVQISSLQTTLRFWTLALSADGKYLYTASPTKRGITVIDAANLSEIKILHDVGERPAVVVAQ